MSEEFILYMAGRYSEKYIDRTVRKKMKDCKYFYIDDGSMIAYNKTPTSGCIVIEQDYEGRFILYTGISDVEQLRKDLEKTKSVEDLDDKYKNSNISLIECRDLTWRNYAVRGNDENSKCIHFLMRFSPKDNHCPTWRAFTTHPEIFSIEKKNLVNQKVHSGGHYGWGDDEKWWELDW